MGIRIFFDGLCEPVNPGGVSTWGIAVLDEAGNILHKDYGLACTPYSKYSTNNYAEYTALIKAANYCISNSINGAEFFGDSQLVVNQINGVYRVNSQNIKPLYIKAMELLRSLHAYEVAWVPREKNTLADEMSRAAYLQFLSNNGSQGFNEPLNAGGLRRMPFGKYRGMGISEIAEQDPSYLRWVIENIEKLDNNLRQDIKTALDSNIAPVKKTPSAIEIPPDLPEHLMSHQKMGVALAEKHPKYALFFQTGTGKTATAIEIAYRKKIKTLVVAPISILESAWVSDILKFRPEITVCNLYPLSKEKRAERLGMNYDIFLINFDGFKASYDDIKDAGFKMLIVDESSKMKSPQSQISAALNQFAKEMDYTYLLSGTPAPNTPLEYFMQIDALQPGLLGNNYWEFRNSYFFQPDPRNQWKWVISNRRKQELLSRIKKTAVFVSKEEAIDLPETVFISRIVEMNDKQKEAYNSYLQSLLGALKDDSKNRGELFKSIMKLREITSGFMYEDINEDEESSKARKVIELSDAKFVELYELLEDIGDQQVIIWANFKYEINKIAKKLGKKAVSLYSGTKDREAVINSFKSGKAQYLIANPQTAGHGLTFTNCSYAIYFSLNYSLELWLQSLDRIHRYGQRNKCTYFVLLAKDSIDGIMYHKLQKKQEISADILEKLKILDRSEHQTNKVVSVRTNLVC